jgi:hypothetical protein
MNKQGSSVAKRSNSVQLQSGVPVRRFFIAHNSNPCLSRH